MAAEPDVPQLRYRRNERLLWRVLPAMVMTQSVDGDPGTGVSELTGAAALVWAVLDEPLTEAEIATALGVMEDPSVADSIQHAISQLLRSGHLRPTGRSAPGI